MTSGSSDFDARPLIPLSEAIYYIEELLKESSQLFVCVNCSAPIFQKWHAKTYSVLSVIYGEDSNHCMFLESIKFGSDNKRSEYLRGIGEIVRALREWVMELKRHVALNTFSRDCFVAMWFDTSLEELYHRGIYSPLKALGYNAIRIDKEEHNERIDQLIFEKIRRSRFVVADFTGQRSGVYYESGFASGLGLPVIHICSKADFDNCHFDVKTINTIVYDSVDDLAARLKDRVSGTIKD